MEASLNVRRARVVHAAASRADVEHWLTRVPLERLGLAGDEIFYLPRLRLRVPARAGRAGGGVPDLILDALRAELAGAASGPAEGFQPGRAYRFRSRSRYRAWLVHLWLGDGSPAAREAFRAATGERSLGPWQRATLLRDAAGFVATLARLAEAGGAARWIAHFDRDDFALVSRTLEERFALRLDLASGSPGGAPYAPPPAGAPPEASYAVVRALIGDLEACGNRWALLTPPGRILLLAASDLAQAPSRPPRQRAAIITAITALATQQHTAPGADVRESPGPARPRPVPATRAIHAATPEPPPIMHRPSPAPATPAPRRDAAGHPDRPATPPEVRRAMVGKGVVDPVEAPGGHDIALPDALKAPTGRPVRPAALFAPDASFDTGFGGLLFLLNAFVALDLYPDFTAPRRARLEPSPLWLADRIGRYWFGARYRRDPLAAWIAGHAAPGSLPDAWRAEPGWLIGFGSPVAPRLAHRHGRETMWHAAGFPLVDAKRPLVQRRPRVVSGFRHPVVQRLPAARRLPRNPTDRWAACLALYLDARLRLLCGGGLSLLARPARIQVCDLDLKAVFALDHHPIELRIAGLDRNPGWSPAEGRAFAFVFA